MYLHTFEIKSQTRFATGLNQVHMMAQSSVADDPDDSSINPVSKHPASTLQQPWTPRLPSQRSPLVPRKSSGSAEWPPKQHAGVPAIGPKDAIHSTHRPKISVSSISDTPPTSRIVDASRSATESPPSWSPAYRGPRGDSGSAFLNSQSTPLGTGLKSHRRLVDLFYMALENDSKSFNHDDSLRLSHKVPSRLDLAPISTGASHRSLNAATTDGAANSPSQNDDSPTQQLIKLGQPGGVKPPSLPPSFVPASQTLRYSLNIDLILDTLIANSTRGRHLPDLEILSDALDGVTSFLEVKLDEPSPSERHHVDQMVVHIERLFDATKNLELHLELERHRFGVQYSKGITECTERLDSLAVQIQGQRERLDAARGEILRCKTTMTHSMAQQLNTLEYVELRFKQYDSRRWKKRFRLFLLISVLFIAMVAIAAASGSISVPRIRGRSPG